MGRRSPTGCAAARGDPRYAAYIDQVRSKALVDGVTPAIATSTAATPAPKPMVAVEQPKPSAAESAKEVDGDSIASHFIY